MPKEEETERETFGSFLNLFANLQERAVSDGALILVEGPKDKRSLISMGIPDGSIVILHSGMRLNEMAEDLVRRSRPVVVLTDWDGKGAQLARRMSEMLRGLGVETDTQTRRNLAHSLRGAVTHVEGIYPWAERLSIRLKMPIIPEVYVKG